MYRLISITVVVCLAMVGASSPSSADIIQLIYDPGNHVIPNTEVRIENGVSMDAYTDQRGRMILDLPPGKYLATVNIEGRILSFEIAIDGQQRVKVHRLRFWAADCSSTPKIA